MILEAEVSSSMSLAKKSLNEEWRRPCAKNEQLLSKARPRTEGSKDENLTPNFTLWITTDAAISMPNSLDEDERFPFRLEVDNEGEIGGNLSRFNAMS